MKERDLDRPNVLVVFTDQQRWDTTGIHGNPLQLTPNFDRMAQRGTHFAQAFPCQPLCGPARSCLQTGLYATQTGVYRNNPGLREDAVTLAHLFGEAGYTTGYIGKWHLSPTQIVPEALRGGYQYWLAASFPEWRCSEPYHAVLFDNDSRPVRLPGYRVDATTDAAIRYIDEHQDQPFYLMVSHVEPHFQNYLDDYPPPDGYRERYAGRWVPPDLAALGGSTHQHLGGYYGMVKRLDEALGRLLDALRSLDLLDKTIVLFTSDHGCHFKTRNAEYKRSCHESSIRIPMAAQGPGFDSGGQVRQLVSLVDVPATLVDAAGLEVPEHMLGRSALPLVWGESTEWPEEVFVQISESQVGRAIRTERWKYSAMAPGKDGRKDSWSNRYVEEFLYDLKADPYELCNLIGMERFSTVTDHLRERLIRRMVEAGESEPSIECAPPATSVMSQRSPDLDSPHEA